eukprot:TRINITY_DN3664_c0_g3_i1.p1 TRINITY_DN3664_c0_g3~~TRINITY_DN3664_c0_g3_i1.p1  ORF type:complete len:427 (+),score=158.26 TRINITY_DN3664_c0_g3_i1:57-1283(+)
MDAVKSIDTQNRRITVQAGCTVRTILDSLRAEGLTLSNFSSIVEQEAAGWTQVAAHGTGATLPTVEEQIVGMRVATPSGDILDLTEADGELFSVAKANAGSLGVVTELTLACCDRHNLLETVAVETHDALWKGHADRLQRFRHVKYMFIPYHDEAVVVTADPTHLKRTPVCKKKEREALAVLKAACGRDIPGGTFSAYRGEILEKTGVLDPEAVSSLNGVELEFWRKAQGSRIADSLDVLGFDCGGQQWVFETCFPNGTVGKPAGNDTGYLRDLMQLVKQRGMPLPSPIEVRYTAASSAMLSPAHSQDPEALFAWVGIVMYFPSGSSDAQREAITESFRSFSKATHPIMEKYRAVPHWAKAEVSDTACLALMADRYRSGLASLDTFRKTTDPDGCLTFGLLEKLNELR